MPLANTKTELKLASHRQSVTLNFLLVHIKGAFPHQVWPCCNLFLTFLDEEPFPMFLQSVVVDSTLCTSV